MKPDVSVVAGVIERDGRYLVVRRSRGAWQGWWEFPGGKIEPGETAEVALLRELSEELGIVVQVGRPLITAFHPIDETSQQGESTRTPFIAVSAYLAHWRAGELRLSAHDELRWMSAEALSEETPSVETSGYVRLLPADVVIVEALR